VIEDQPSLTWGPRDMFSVAARSTFFFGGMMKSFELLVDKRYRGWARSSKRSYRIRGLLASCAALVALARRAWQLKQTEMCPLGLCGN
jgi:hypothetical protein